MKKFKIVVLFLTILCSFSLGIVYFRNDYISRKQEEAIKLADDLVLSRDNEKEEELLRVGTIGVIEIPSISVKAPISQGTSSNVLKYYVRTFRKYK